MLRKNSTSQNYFSPNYFSANEPLCLFFLGGVGVLRRARPAFAFSVVRMALSAANRRTPLSSLEVSQNDLKARYNCIILFPPIKTNSRLNLFRQTVACLEFASTVEAPDILIWQCILEMSVA